MTREKNKKFIDDNEEITGNNCPKCNYPTVREYGLEVCYHCGWAEEDEEKEC